MTVRILIADDHALVRDGLRMNLEAREGFTVVGSAMTGREAVAKTIELAPDVVIMDIAMPELNGIEATRLICEQLPEVKVLVLSMYNSSEHCYRALRSGARGYLLKESAGEEVVTAVSTVMRGRQYFGAGVVNPLEGQGQHQQNSHKSPLESLSRRELEIFQLVVEGKSSSEIAVLLALSSKSVDTYRSRLMQKLGVHNIPSLVSFALQHGITPAR
ncbi:DNA-binding response regulator [Geomonas silvestris]|uniref:DNA-binding response regulator n=1 Tax=Geomonas silvestris TaxID=2740184 RepID=A0A6V8MHW3_9BACT|nr:response regulator transcription factor [Geomonas silvestris]GFO59239.1 DNA-binding response regulator [Geomonas silvestris]